MGTVPPSYAVINLFAFLYRSFFFRWVIFVPTAKRGLMNGPDLIVGDLISYALSERDSFAADLFVGTIIIDFLMKGCCIAPRVNFLSNLENYLRMYIS